MKYETPPDWEDLKRAVAAITAGVAEVEDRVGQLMQSCETGSIESRELEQLQLVVADIETEEATQLLLALAAVAPLPQELLHASSVWQRLVRQAKATPLLFARNRVLLYDLLYNGYLNDFRKLGLDRAVDATDRLLDNEHVAVLPSVLENVLMTLVREGASSSALRRLTRFKHLQRLLARSAFP